MVFSVREAETGELYRRAAEKAWREIETRLRQLAAAAPGKSLEVVEVSYDPLPGESVIEELPELPKSSRPQAVEVSVRLRATYVLH
ncbi:MAG: hypothetical protein ABSH05_17660 [Bryobacteraceae bacterium]